MSEFVEALKRVALFRGLDDAQLERLTHISERNQFGDGDAILTVDRPGDHLFVLVRGQVEVQIRDEDGALRPALYLGEGQVFGEMALLEGTVRSATVRAAQPATVVYTIPRSAFLDLCAADTGLGYLVMRNLAQDLSFKLRHQNIRRT